MAAYGARELAASFRTVRNNTITIAEELPEDKYGFQPVPEYRTAGQLLTHIALGHKFAQQIHAVERRATLQGLDFMGLMQRARADEQQARNKSQIVQLLRTNGEQWAAWLEGLSDSFLAEHVAMPQGAAPASKSRLEMLLSVKEHEMHHRAQLMLIERMLGMVPHLTRQAQERMQQMAAAAKA